MEQPWWCEHPAVHRVDLKACIPLVVHSDGAESFTNVETMVWSVASLLTNNVDPFDSKFVVCLVQAMFVPTKAILDVGGSADACGPTAARLRFANFEGRNVMGDWARVPSRSDSMLLCAAATS